MRFTISPFSNARPAGSALPVGCAAQNLSDPCARLEIRQEPHAVRVFKATVDIHQNVNYFRRVGVRSCACFDVNKS
jgi:hypothetical protein